MRCKIIWGWIQSGFISLPVVWLAGFPTNYGFMRAFKKHIFNSRIQSPSRLEREKQISNGFTSKQSLSEEGNWSEAETQRQKLRPLCAHNANLWQNFGALLLAPAHLMCAPWLPDSLQAFKAKFSDLDSSLLPYLLCSRQQDEGKWPQVDLKLDFICHLQ